mmetsp:Transcript_8506/g.12588  ORF Transcript_8506/g.12588 Transcript_8506/m.12588 type:complete len:400 (-) Transcript_8506:60-1259(-)|eukprot:CAMPEP_0196811190 /NCGR_PEP_ID=MMETSP1362-20130617/17001_1 /TAXON_ID=163516 /ORGANISM="Leptocylindrus danicus, Strain CCMP1856" /LENGTH=399 /DNA_ID=CAMNT_0042186453 /DNA_START=26 /DNA_END=1225 /DNA_ORIENTATION=+
MSDEEEIHSNAEEEEEEITDLSSSDVCTKYQEAAKIVNLALQGLILQCVPGAKIIDLCQFGTTVIETQAAKLYTKKVEGAAVEKGVAFPVCISVNEIVCNHSPLPTEELAPIKAGDIVKIDLGCHIDGYIAVAAHTLVVPDGDASPAVDSKLGNVAVAAYNAMLVASAHIKAGSKNTEVTAAVEKVAKTYGVSPISSVRMHQMKRFVIDGVKEVALKEPNPDDQDELEEKVPECEFEQYEVYAIDVAMSTGEGKARPADLRTTVFKRNVESNYKLKMKASRQLLSEVDKKYPTLPFTLSHFEDERTAKMGVNECVGHGLLIPYPSLAEKVDEKVAHFKCTVLLLPSGTTRVSGLELPEYFKSDVQVDEETAAVLKEIEEAAERKARRAAKKKAAKKKKK